MKIGDTVKVDNYDFKVVDTQGDYVYLQRYSWADPVKVPTTFIKDGKFQ